MMGFAAELERARGEGVTHPENLPFLFEPKRPNGKALLLVHGFGASPYEMRLIGDLLCTRGYLILGARLAGHGTNPEDLRRCQWQDWFDSVERCYTILQESGLPISLIGQSTGALLSLLLAHQRKVERLILLSPFLKLKHPLASVTGLLKHLIPFQQRQLPHPERLHYYERRPLGGIEQIGQLRDKIVHILPQVKIPTLLLAAEGDQTVAKGTGFMLFEKLGSSDKEFHLFGPEVPHVLSTIENPEFDKTCHFIENFLLKNDMHSTQKSKVAGH
jgi:carboxylesterase